MLKPRYVSSSGTGDTDSIEELIDLIATGTITPFDQDTRKLVSSYRERIPLYDIRSDHIYLIDWKNIFERIFYDSYRLIDNDLYQELQEIDDRSPTQQQNLNILSWYDFDILNKIFLKLFYNSFIVNSYITNCTKPAYYQSFPHIDPYYSISEINYFAIDWGLSDKVVFDNKEIKQLCKKIRSLDISSKTLIAHQLYIYRSHAIGLVKHYSLYGSYYMNVYLRKTNYAYRNRYLENQIKIMTKMIKNAPAFDGEHTLYRFVDSDKYIQHLKPGDTYQDPSFMSTTRNPFYYKKSFTPFGYILIKILIPGDIEGVGLCIESYSNFPFEEEIILAPGSRYRLDSVDSNPTDFHNHFDLKVSKKYVFTWLGFGSQKKIDAEYPPTITINLLDIIQQNSVKYLTISDRINYLRESLTNANNQFETDINDKRYTFSLESYNSSTIYGDFFFFETAEGIMLTTANPVCGNINLLIEIGTSISVNYYFKYSVTDPSIVIDLDNPGWMEWLSMLSYILGIRNVIIHSNYILKNNPNDSVEKSIAKTRYTFSQNIYLYMTEGKRMYDYLEVTPNFDYKQIDILKLIKVTDHISKTDRNELYRIYQTSNTENMFDFYLYIIENYPRFTSDLEHKFEEIYDPKDNPFNHLSYTLDAWLYLNSKDIIKEVPTTKQSAKGSFKKLIGDKKIPVFKNRLRAAS